MGGLTRCRLVRLPRLCIMFLEICGTRSRGSGFRLAYEGKVTFNLVSSLILPRGTSTEYSASSSISQRPGEATRKAEIMSRVHWGSLWGAFHLGRNKTG
jgi:hypothetical protein